MDIDTYFIKALQAEAFRWPEWIREVFGVTEQTRDNFIKNQFAYRVFRQGEVFFFSNPDEGGQLTVLSKAVAGKALIDYTSPITLTPEMGIPGVNKPITTSYGNVLVNYVCILFPFRGNIGFQAPEKSYYPSYIESLYVDKCLDDPPEGEPKDPKKIYVSDHVQYMQGVRFLEQQSAILVPTVSRKTMTCSPEMIKRKKELFEQYKDQLDDPAILARISEELQAIDKAWMKDDIGRDVLINKKDFSVIRREYYGFSGGNQGFGGETIPGIKNSLSEGWDIDSFPDYNNALRVASYDRGFQTAMAGSDYKDIIRATSNSQVVKGDCGSKLGYPQKVTEENAKNFFGLTLIDDKAGLVKVTKDNVNTYMGKVVRFRSPMYCNQQEGDDICEICAGDRLSLNPTALSGAMALIASLFQNIYMQAAHGKALETTEYSMRDSLS